MCSTESKVDWIYVDGVYDLVHSGHLNGIRQASTLGHRLCVGVNPDHEVWEAKKSVPILDVHERAEILAACRWVDRVIPGAPYVTPLRYLLDVARCDAVAHGDDLVVGPDGEDCYKEPRAAGCFRVFRRTSGVSSTTILCRLLLAACNAGLAETAECEHLFADPDVAAPIAGPIDTRRIAEFIGEARAERCQERSPNRRVVYTCGTFDLLRRDIINFLREAKSKGDYLIVGLYEDRVASDIWGEGHPVLGQTERMMNLYAIGMVDEIILNAPFPLATSFLKRYAISEVVLPLAQRLDVENVRQKAAQMEASFLSAEAKAATEVNVHWLEAATVNCLWPTLVRVASAYKNGECNLQHRNTKNAAYKIRGSGVQEVQVEL